MTASQTVCSATSDRVVAHKSAYNIEVSGNWNLRGGRRHLNAIFVTNFWINTVLLLCSLVLTVYLIFVLHDAKTCCFEKIQLLEKISTLEARIANLESSRIEPIPAYFPLAREKRSVENASREREIRGKKKNIRAVQFISSNPGLFAVQPLQGVIGPWIEQSVNVRMMDTLGLKLIENDRKLEVSRAGVYFIYSQVTYPSRYNANSYSINLISTGEKSISAISICSAAGEQISDSEVSCYTSTLRTLKSGDVVFLQQVEQNRDINLDRSSTYFGMILLNE